MNGDLAVGDGVVESEPGVEDCTRLLGEPGGHLKSESAARLSSTMILMLAPSMKESRVLRQVHVGDVNVISLISTGRRKRA